MEPPAGREPAAQTAPPVLRCDDELAPATRGLARSAGFCPSVWRLTSLARKAHRGVTRRSDRDETIRYETIRDDRSYTIRDRRFGFLHFRKVPQPALALSSSCRPPTSATNARSRGPGSCRGGGSIPSTSPMPPQLAHGRRITAAAPPERRFPRVYSPPSPWHREHARNLPGGGAAPDANAARTIGCSSPSYLT